MQLLEAPVSGGGTPKARSSVISVGQKIQPLNDFGNGSFPTFRAPEIANTSLFDGLRAMENQDYGPQFDEPETFGMFDFGRDRSSLKRQRLFFRDRLPSNNIQTNGRESLL